MLYVKKRLLVVKIGAFNETVKIVLIFKEMLNKEENYYECYE